MKNEVPAKGGLKHYSLSEILTFLNKRQKTGILSLEKNNIKKSIYFKDGIIISASSNDNNDRLCDMLLSAGKITTEEYSKSAEISKQTDKRQDTILAEMGCITPKELFLEVKNQIREIILSLFEWEDSTFMFEETSPSAEVITLKIPVEELIREGIHRIENKKKRDDAIFIQKVNELYENIGSLTYYDILKVQINASPSAIKKAYLQKVKHYHPDRYQSVSNSVLRDKLTTLFNFFNNAYDTLSSKVSRTEYDKSLLKMQKKDARSDIIKAKEQFKRGIGEFKKGNFWGAVDFFRVAKRLEPKKATYWSHLSLALSRIPKRAKEAEEAMLKAIELEPHNANYYVHLGIIYLKSGMKQRAIRQFEAALIWDTTNTRAHKELERLKGKK